MTRNTPRLIRVRFGGALVLIALCLLTTGCTNTLWVREDGSGYLRFSVEAEMLVRNGSVVGVDERVASVANEIGLHGWYVDIIEPSPEALRTVPNGSEIPVVLRIHAGFRDLAAAARVFGLDTITLEHRGDGTSHLAFVGFSGNERIVASGSLVVVVPGDVTQSTGSQRLRTDTAFLTLRPRLNSGVTFRPIPDLE